MAKPNYSFQKRQRELAKKQKKEEKRKQKMGSDEPVTDVVSETAATPPIVEKVDS